jgi:hypothetical protein
LPPVDIPVDNHVVFEPICTGDVGATDRDIPNPNSPASFVPHAHKVPSFLIAIV